LLPGEMIDTDQHNTCMELFELYKKYKHLWPEFDAFVDIEKKIAEEDIEYFKSTQTEDDQ